MADGYVSNWGNDINNGLSWATAKKTAVAAKSAGLAPIYFKGFFNESFPDADGTHIYGINPEQSIIDGTGLSYAMRSGSNSAAYNIAYITFQNCPSVIFTGSVIGGPRAERIHHCVFKNNINNNLNYSAIIYNNLIYSTVKQTATFGILRYNNTVHNQVVSIEYITSLYSKNNIFSNCDIILPNTGGNPIDNNLYYTLFINCRFKFTGEASYTYPTGADDDAMLENLRTRMVTAFGGVSTNYLPNCKYYSGTYNNIFLDADNGNFNLVANCIATTMSSNGTYIGARPEGRKYNWSADWTNIVNIDSNGYIIDQTIDASAESHVLDVGYVRRILNLQVSGQRAYRNGQQVNTVSNLGSDITAGANVLTAGKIYQCLNDTVTLDGSVGTTFNPYQCYYAIDSGGGSGNNDLGFSGSGIMKEVLISDYTEKIQIRCSKTDPTLSTATLITCDLNESPIKVNVDTNGEPIYGSQDVGYTIGTATDLFTKYIKIYLKIKANNIAAR